MCLLKHLQERMETKYICCKYFSKLDKYNGIIFQNYKMLDRRVKYITLDLGSKQSE